MGLVRFKIEDHLTTAEVLNQEKTTSRNTGKELLELEVRFRYHENMRNFYTQALSNGTAMLLPTDGDVSKGIKVGLYEKQQSMTVGEPIQHSTWLLTQREELTLEALQIGDFTLTPYKYEDHFDGESLVCTMSANMDAETYKALRELPLYFPVIRKGINEEPRPMRLGLVLWSSEDEQTYKVKATLVEETRDKDGRPSLNLLEPMFTHVKQQLALTSARFSQLVNLLEDKGVLTKEEADKVWEVSDSELQKREQEYFRVKDLDAWDEL